MISFKYNKPNSGIIDIELFIKMNCITRIYDVVTEEDITKEGENIDEYNRIKSIIENECYK